ncbi:MAG: LysR family transcriptional regulator [Lachnospiraceae bacterium]|nr:LysR family transcriptional regulator [Lachnospiraceae bacterium]
MTFHQLQCFIQVAEQLSFIGAAKKLYTTQPAVTYQIRMLEKELNTRLFYRTNRRVSLTETGRAFYQASLKIWESYQDVLLHIEDIEKRNRSYITIGVRRLFDYSILSGFVKNFNGLRPDIKVEVIPQSDYEPLEYLYTGKTNISFLFDTECAENEDVAFLPIYEMNYYLLVEEHHPLIKHTKLSPADLAGQKVILPEDNYRRSSHIPPIETLLEVGADLSLTSPSFEGTLILVQAGMGIAVITSTADKKFPCMEKILLDVPPLHIGMAWLKNNTPPETLQFMDLVKERYRPLSDSESAKRKDNP